MVQGTLNTVKDVVIVEPAMDSAKTLPLHKHLTWTSTTSMLYKKLDRKDLLCA